MLVVIMVLGILFAMTVPTMVSTLDSLRLGQAAREVEREIHMAKSRAVSKARAIRIRFNCPMAGQYRITELIGTPSVPVAADTAANRCNELVYPFPAPDNNPVTLPNLDGPVRYLPEDISFVAPQTIEFWPDGTAHYSTGATLPWTLVPVTGINIAVIDDDNGKTATISVNGLGKILLTN
jgi:type II secretory pathway pseudopilin PulG